MSGRSAPLDHGLQLKLTKRQIETIELMMQGLVVKQIAHRMKIGERTVKEFRRQAMDRLKARTACELVAKYILEFRKNELRPLENDRPGRHGARR